jgi:hypothetical protein
MSRKPQPVEWSKLTVWLGKWALRFLYGTNRWRVTGEHHYRDLLAEGKSVILAIWHGQLLVAFTYFRERQFYGLAGTHRDADLIARIGAREGWHFLRGSSSERGSAAFRRMVGVLKTPGAVLTITPDGPQGPARIPKPGAIRAAQLTGVPIVPMAAQSTRHWILKNWDAFYLAQPFGRIEVQFGPPLWFTREDDIEASIQRLKQALDTLTQEVESRAQS